MLAIASQAHAHAQSNDSLDALANDVMNEIMKGSNLAPGVVPSASGVNRRLIARLQKHRRMLIDQHVRQLPQVVAVSKTLADYQKNYADLLFKMGKYREALPLYEDVHEERKRRTGSESAATSSSLGDVAKVIQQLIIEGR